MNQDIATTVFESLASGIRLVAGEIAATLGLPPNNLSFHLKGLTQEGRFQRYRANLPLMLELIAYLTAECCGGHPEQCATLGQAAGCSPALLPALQGQPPNDQEQA
jgi:hypothetical protein